MIGTRSPPTSRNSHHHGSGFHGSPGRSQHPQAGSVVRSHRIGPVGHQRPHRGRADPQVRDPVPLDQVPQPVGSRKVGRALVDHERGAQQQGAGHRPWTHHPAHVREPEQDVAALEVEAVGEVHRALEREAAVDVDRALGLPGRAAGVDQHVRVVGVGRDRWQRIVPGRLERRAPLHVAALGPRHVPRRHPEPAHDQASLHGRRVGQRGIGHRLHVHHLPAPPEAVRGDEQLRLAVGQPAGHRRRPVAREDGRVDRPQLAGGQDRDHRLGNHRHEDPDPIAAAHAQRSHRPRRPVHLGPQRGPRVATDRAVLPLPDERLARPATRRPGRRRRQRPS